ncbi:hypothetical protein O6H91_09G022400 [Diphasiastrum complanatum]|uniref:Uncharacterized protein n=1 Tax=Diphasiastrum complanatum TaxID=34168 RepID=A0ACC2CM48_DIPCM|nr:hypothetical protein O6H91_09G022400 [Diphasiastrum complanatum]
MSSLEGKRKGLACWASRALIIFRRQGIDASIVQKFGYKATSIFSLKHHGLQHVHSGSSSDSSDSEDDFHGKGSGDTSVQHQGQQVLAADNDNGAKDKGKWTQQLAWLSSILEPALSLYKRALPPDKGVGTASTRSLVDIATSLHRSNYGMQHWSLGDVTIGLYLLSLRHASEMAVDAIDGEKISSAEMQVQNLLYHVEVAKGAYSKSAAAVARVSLLRESNILKFIDKASVMQPAYYIAVDHRQKLVVLCIRGTQSVHDLITDLASHGQEETFGKGNVHYGTAEAARWFLYNEVETLKRCLAQHVGYSLRLVGHSLGGATASLLAMMMRKNAKELLGISRDRISAVGVATPPCVSENLAVDSSDFITTLVLQDDVMPRMSAAALVHLRDEILLIDWTSILKGEDRKGLLDLVASTLQALSSVQDVARRYATYARISNSKEKESACADASDKGLSAQSLPKKQAVNPTEKLEQLFCPGLLFHVTGRPCPRLFDNGITETREGCVLVKGHPGTRFGRIILSGTMFSDHKCDSYYYSLRDVLKGL